MVSHIQGCVEHTLKEDKAGLSGGTTVANPEKTMGKLPSSQIASPAKRRAKAVRGLGNRT
jgi:hypothetical protein